MGTTEVYALAQYAPQAISLFNNMRTPASILGGSIVPLGLMSPLPLSGDKGESKFKRVLRVLYSVVAVSSLASELLAVIWASVAANQLTERPVAEAESVWALLKRDYELEWAATNAHFVGGMLGFLFLVATRSFFHANGGILGRSLAGIACSSLLLMVAIVNRAVAAGSGDGIRFGASIVSLWSNYAKLLLKRASNPDTFGVLELASTAIFLWSIQGALRSTIDSVRDDNDEKKQKKK